MSTRTVHYRVGFAPMGCYVVRVDDVAGTEEAIAVGIKGFREAVALAAERQAEEEAR